MEKRLFVTSIKQICNEYLIKFSENQSAPMLENRKTCAPNLLHVLVSRILGYHNLWHKLCSPVQAGTLFDYNNQYEMNMNHMIINPATLNFLTLSIKGSLQNNTVSFLRLPLPQVRIFSFYHFNNEDVKTRVSSPHGYTQFEVSQT